MYGIGIGIEILLAFYLVIVLPCGLFDMCISCIQCPSYNQFFFAVVNSGNNNKIVTSFNEGTEQSSTSRPDVNAFQQQRQSAAGRNNDESGSDRQDWGARERERWHREQ